MSKNDPIRLQKYLSECGFCSRRKAEEYIQNGKVRVNGHIASLGDKINPRHDIVTVGKTKIVRSESERVYLMLNKPRGFVSTMSDELGRRCVADLLKDVPQRVFPAGRLDKDSEGLLLFSNDGEFINMMTHPSGHVSKTYRVTVKNSVSDEILEELRNGVEIDTGKTRPCEIYVVTEENDRTVLEFILNEGKNRQIRKMCECFNLDVARLKRIAMGNLKLGHLPAGKWRLLNEREIRDLISLSDAKKSKQNKE